MPNDLKDRRKDINGSSVADFEEERAKNRKGGYWGCVCGSRKFFLLQQAENVKAICVKCEETDIIYWNGSKDSSAGSMRRLDSNRWVKQTVRLEVK